MSFKTKQCLTSGGTRHPREFLDFFRRPGWWGCWAAVVDATEFMTEGRESDVGNNQGKRQPTDRALRPRPCDENTCLQCFDEIDGVGRGDWDIKRWLYFVRNIWQGAIWTTKWFKCHSCITTWRCWLGSFWIEERLVGAARASRERS